MGDGKKGESKVTLVKFMNAAGNHAWVDPAAVEAIDALYSDASLEGRRGDAKLLTRLHLRSGAKLDLDADAETVARTLSGGA